MKKVNGFWIDENNNRWDCAFFTEERAQEHSNSLINCNYCSNCSKCSYCNYCSNCSKCKYCSNCNNCSYCNDCNYCSHCNSLIDCNDCNNCRYCSYCSKCSYCNDCNYCHYCSNYNNNPQRYTTSNLGSRNNNTTFYYGKTTEGEMLQVICGCFRGNLEEFEQAVNETHGNNEYGKQYKKEIEKVKILFEL